MASTWDGKYMHHNLYEEFEEHFKNAAENSIVTYFRGLVNVSGKAKLYQDSLQLILSAWEFVSQQGSGVPGENAEQVGQFTCSLCRASRELVLSGDWSQATDAELRKRVESQVRRCLASQGQGQARSGLEGLLGLLASPWDTPRLRQLLTGKTEQQQQVLELVSVEGVDCVLLRTELLVEAGLDNPAYRFVSNVTNSLLADHIVFESFVMTSRVGSLERLVDLFLALALATRHEARLYKVLRLLGIEEVNNVYMARFLNYMSPPQTPPSDERLVVSVGRCVRLLTPLVCGKVIKVFAQWSIAGASVMECPPDLQETIIKRWLEERGRDGVEDTIGSLLSDVETLLKSANQTSFLYSLASQLWKKVGKEVESQCLKMFIKGITSDLNASEACKKNKSKKYEIEKRMARGFWLLSQVAGEKRVSLARECVLTGFSICPSQQGLDRIKELAVMSGLDKLEVDHVDTEEQHEDDVEESSTVSGLHCRVPLEKARKKTGFSKQAGVKGSDKKSGQRLKPKFEKLDKLDFESLSSGLMEDLGRPFGRADTKLSNKNNKKKKFRNLEGLLSIQGELITEASNYDPLAMPCQSLSSENLGLSKQITDDLLIIISAPRWHMLSWVMDWSELESACTKLLENPGMRVPSEELKFLNIDYTQFDEWSSDEEVTIYTGIEKGFEQWLEVRSEDDKFSEHGLSSGDEAVVFNQKHSVDRVNYDSNDNYILNEEYAVKEDLKSDIVMEEVQKSEEAMDINDEITDEPNKETVNDTLEPEPEKQSGEGRRKRGDDIEVQCVTIPSNEMSVEQLRVRLALARLVPGLEGSAVTPSNICQVWMVQISSGQTVPTTSPTTSLLLRPGPSGVTRPAAPRPQSLVSVVTSPSNMIRGQTTATVRLSTLGPTQPNSNKKIQYICKQGGQTFVIESAQVLEKLRNAASSSSGSVQLRLPVTAIRPSTEATESLPGRIGTFITTTSPSPKTSCSVSSATSGTRQVSAILTPSSNRQLVSVTTNSPDVSNQVKQVTEEQDKPSSSSDTSDGPADLIRQLNLARSQGLVVLQQWGDKQVLVHKATGRWIMRQGSRLVTVPPQALGITIPGDSNSNTTPAISSRTMEQLAEFDSILESKFKTETDMTEIGNGGVVVVSGNTKQIIQLPTTPLKKELVLSKEGIKSAGTSPVKSPLLPPTVSFPKPQEDPETMKRIQAILDDYNDQIRNSPDLHNRPAPRRRTNGSGNPDSPKAADSPSSSGAASGSTSPIQTQARSGSCDPMSLSPGSPQSSHCSPTKVNNDPLTVAMAEIKEAGALTLATAPCREQHVTSVRLVPKGGAAVGRGLVQSPVVSPVPSGTQIRGTNTIMVGGPGGPVQRLMVVASGDGRRMVAVRPVVVSNTGATAGIGGGIITVNTSNCLPASVPSTPLPVTVSLPTSPVSISSLPPLALTGGRPNSPPRPSTPGLGIPMEMTPGQIMEAEISATLLDNGPSSPFQLSGTPAISSPDPPISSSDPSPPSSTTTDPPTLPDNVFSSRSISCPPPLDTEFDQEICTSIDTEANHADLPTDLMMNVDTISDTFKRSRRRSGRLDQNQPPSKRRKFVITSENNPSASPMQLNQGSIISERSTT